MSAQTWRWSNSELTRHSSQPAWIGAVLCRETLADHATGVKQIWRIDCAACHLSVLVTRMMVMNTTSNDAGAL